MKNIVVLFTDQQRYDTISAFGNPSIQTPNLDQLARESVIFERCITPSPVCVPARMSLMAGQYPARTGNNNNNSDLSYAGDGFYSRLTGAGYDSCAIGKLHNLWDPYGPTGFAVRHSQEEMPDIKDEYAAYIRGKYPHVFDLHGMRSEMYYMPQISQLPPEDHPTQWVGDCSVEYILNHDESKPLFLFSSFIHPHPPYCPPSPWQKLYREDPPEPYVPPESEKEEFKQMIGVRCSCERLQMSRQDVLRSKNFYYACVSFVDYQVGRIVNALKEKGIYDDTLIVFASDHGDMMGDFDSIGKRTMVDSSCHVPLMVRYPGKTSCRIASPSSLVDIAPTLLAYAGIEYSDNEFDGIDLFGDNCRKYVYSQHACGCNGTYMITDGKQKLIYKAAEDKYYFFKTVPEERNEFNLSDESCAEMKVLLDSYRASDCNHAHDSKTYEKYSKTHPHYPGRMDQSLYHSEEMQAIPAGYTIDLT